MMDWPDNSIRAMARRAPKLAACLLASVLTALAGHTAAQPTITAANIDDDHVRLAIRTIVEELYLRKHPERMWEPAKIPSGDSTRQVGGYTALVVLAMLHAGESYQDPRLREAVEYLNNAALEGTYAVTFRTSVWAKLPPRFREQLQRDAQWLIDGFSEQAAGWDYVQNPRTRRQDNSIRQLGALALWEAAKRGVRVEQRLWRLLEDAYLEMQLQDGGWNYVGDGPATGSMTAAGLATLFITQEQLHVDASLRPSRPARQARQKSASDRHHEAIDRGLAWMDGNFSATENPGKDTYFYYYLYGVERVGLASGYKQFGGHDWFREGAAELIARLLAWDAENLRFTPHQSTYGDGRRAQIRTDDLAFALLFLSRGRVPVAMNKLRLEDGNWNSRPRDAANFVRWLGEATEGDLNWQIVRIESPPEEWLDAPLLYLASNETLPFLADVKIDADQFATEVKEFIARRADGTLPPDAEPPKRPVITELDALKRYLELGGMLLAVNEGGVDKFADSIEAAGLLMFPQFEWRTLPDDHWAYSLHHDVTTRRPSLKALSNGVRELIVLAPTDDLAETLQLNDQRQASVFQTLGNLFFHASELNRPRPRLARHRFQAAPNAQPWASATIVRAIHAGNWRPEPVALELFAGWLAEHRGINAAVIDHPLESIHELEPRPSLAIVSGIDDADFTERQMESVKRYIESGGILLFETPGGRGTFTSSLEAAMSTRFEAPIESLARTRVITGLGLDGAADLSRVEYRPYSLEVFGARETAPRLRGLAISGSDEPQVLFSREDITHGLLDQPCWRISGYTPRHARELLANIVQHAIDLSDARSPGD